MGRSGWDVILIVECMQNLFHLPATITQMHSTQNEALFKDSINSIFCTRTLVITRTNSLALADKTYSARLSRVDEPFFTLDRYSVYSTSHPFCSLFLFFFFHLLLSICNAWITILFPLRCFVSVCGLRSLNLKLFILPVQKTPVVSVCTAALV